MIDANQLQDMMRESIVHHLVTSARVKPNDPFDWRSLESEWGGDKNVTHISELGEMIEGFFFLSLTDQMSESARTILKGEDWARAKANGIAVEFILLLLDAGSLIMENMPEIERRAVRLSSERN